jgi:hypothetical protein
MQEDFISLKVCLDSEFKDSLTLHHPPLNLDPCRTYSTVESVDLITRKVSLNLFMWAPRFLDLLSLQKLQVGGRGPGGEGAVS